MGVFFFFDFWNLFNFAKPLSLKEKIGFVLTAIQNMMITFVLRITYTRRYVPVFSLVAGCRILNVLETLEFQFFFCNRLEYRN